MSKCAFSYAIICTVETAHWRSHYNVMNKYFNSLQLLGKRLQGLHNLRSMLCFQERETICQRTKKCHERHTYNKLQSQAQEMQSNQHTHLYHRPLGPVEKPRMFPNAIPRQKFAFAESRKQGSFEGYRRHVSWRRVGIMGTKVANSLPLWFTYVPLCWFIPDKSAGRARAGPCIYDHIHEPTSRSHHCHNWNLDHMEGSVLLVPYS